MISDAAAFVVDADESGDRFRHNSAKARVSSRAATPKLGNFAYYAFFFLLFWFFFARAMFEMKDGIYTGGSQNLGDLPFHLGAIFSFTDGNNFPPQNPSWSGAKFTYPFIADFLTACFMKLGADVRDAMFTQNLAWAFSLLVISREIFARVTDSKLAGRIAPALLYFQRRTWLRVVCKRFLGIGIGTLAISLDLPRDYTIRRAISVGQFAGRSVYDAAESVARNAVDDFGARIFVENICHREHRVNNCGMSDAKFFRFSTVSSSPFLIGFLAGTLPLIHLHSLVVLFVVTGFLLCIRPEKWREWIDFGIGVCVIAVPQLALVYGRKRD